MLHWDVDEPGNSPSRRRAAGKAASAGNRVYTRKKVAATGTAQGRHRAALDGPRLLLGGAARLGGEDEGEERRLCAGENANPVVSCVLYLSAPEEGESLACYLSTGNRLSIGITAALLLRVRPMTDSAGH